MSKEYLEALNKIQHDFGQLKGQELVNCYELIFNGLKRLEAIDNAEPSEALDQINYMISNCIITAHIEERLEKIKQYILKAQEQEKVLKIILEKNVDIWTLKESENLAQYNFSMASKKYNLVKKMGFKTPIFYLEQEEFDLLKEWKEVKE